MCLSRKPKLFSITALLLWFTLTGCANNPTTIQNSATKQTNAEAKLWSQLQQAKTHYFVLMRHSLAPGTGDPANFELGDCSTQRNLSEAGRNQARRTGEAFKERNIQVKEVLSSQWCRCLDTAKLMDLGTVKPFSPLNSFFRDRSTQTEQTTQVRDFILEQKNIPGVTIMVTHFVNISALTRSGVSSGELVIIKVDQRDQLEVVGRIDPL